MLKWSGLLILLLLSTWVIWGVVMFGMIGARREKALYISMWYYIACFLGVAMLYLFNNMEVPTILFLSVVLELGITL